MSDGQVIFEIAGDSKPIKRTLNETTSALEKEGRKWESAAKGRTDSIASAFEGMFKKISAAAIATKVAHELLEWGKAAVQAASDLEEVQNVVDVTFGDGAQQIQQWANTARKQFGLTEVQAKKFTSTLGAMMKSAGLAGPEIVQMSTDLAGLAADMASFYNLDFDTAFQKIRSGISGETEPLKQLGINMSVANLQAYALQQGITTAFDKMSQGEQTMLRYQYLMQATADAQGDFARTSDGYANSLRLLETNMSTLTANIGKMLIPKINSLVTAINGMFEAFNPDTEEHKSAIDAFNEIDLDTEKKIAEINKTADEALALVDVLDKISGAQDVKTNLTTFVNVLSSQLGDLGAALDAAKNGDYAGTISAISEAMALKTGTSAEKWSTLFTAIAEKLPAASTAAMSDEERTAAFLQAAADAAAALGSDYPELWDQFLTMLGDDAGAAVTALAGVSEGLTQMQALKTLLTVQTGLETFVGLLSDDLGDLGDALAAAKTGDYSGTISAIAAAMELKTGTSAEKWETLLNTVATYLPGATDATASDEEQTAAWLKAAAAAAAALGPEYPELWAEFLGILGEDAGAAMSALAQAASGVTAMKELAASAQVKEGLKTFVGVLSGELGDLGDALSAATRGDYAGTISAIASAMALKTGTNVKDWETLLSAIADKLPAAAAAATTDDERTAAFLQAAAEAAAELGEGYPALWESLLSVLGENAGAALSALADASSGVSTLESLASAASGIKANTANNWTALLNALNNTSGLKGMFGDAKTAASTIESLSKALSGVGKEKAAAWNELLTVLSEHADQLMVLTGKSATDTQDWLATIAEGANALDPDSADGWSELFTALVNGMPGLTTSEEGRAFLQSLASDYNLIGNSTDTASDYLNALGVETDDIVDSEKMWLDTLAKLKQEIPGIADLIDEQTGLLKVGSEEFARYIEDYRGTQEKLLLWKAYYAKEAALQDIKAVEYEKKLPVIAAQARLDKIVKEAQDYLMGELMSSDEYAAIQNGGTFSERQKVQESVQLRRDKYKRDKNYKAWVDNLAEEFAKDYSENYSYLMSYVFPGNKTGVANETLTLEESWFAEMANFEKVNAEYQKEVEANREQTEILAEEHDALVALFGEEEDAADGAADSFANMTAEEKAAALAAAAFEQSSTSALTNVQDALKAVTDYYQTAREETARELERTITGFAAIETPAQKARKEMDSLTKDIERLKAAGKSTDSLELRHAEYEGTIVSAQNMRQGLESQIDYMTEYLDNLEKAKSLGVDQGILSMLSTGSVEDADYLAALAKASDNEIKDINNKWHEMQKLRDGYTDDMGEYHEGFADALTAEKLTADDAFNGLVETLESTVNSLDLAGSAESAMHNTVEGIVNGIASAIPDLATQVDAVIAELARLDTVSASNFGFRYSAGLFGNSSVYLGKFGISRNNPSNGLLDVKTRAIGDDYVPYDGFLASLHEGESILTAEEARVWRNLKYGATSSRNSVDYDALHGAIWDGAPNMGGGNVYLNGEKVGRVISAQQADSLRTLERSGWQG